MNVYCTVYCCITAHGAGCTTFCSVRYKLSNCNIPYMVSFVLYTVVFIVWLLFFFIPRIRQYAFLPNFSPLYGLFVFPHVLFHLSIEYRFAPYVLLPNWKYSFRYTGIQWSEGRERERKSADRELLVLGNRRLERIIHREYNAMKYKHKSFGWCEKSENTDCICFRKFLNDKFHCWQIQFGIACNINICRS